MYFYPKFKYMQDSCFIRFSTPIDSYSLPEKFTFPFNYEPHNLCKIAAKELQTYLESQTEWKHEFGLNHFVEGTNIGKMFGVLIVQNQNNEIGYVTAFSGKLAGSQVLPRFVPPIVNILLEDGFYRKGEAQLNEINAKIASIENSQEYKDSFGLFDSQITELENSLESFKTQMQKAKNLRDEQRKTKVKELDAEAFAELEENLRKESIMWHYENKKTVAFYKQNLQTVEQQKQAFYENINKLKDERKQKSAQLQQQMFDEYVFLNSLGQKKTVCKIFEKTEVKIPPSGAGECAAPKLLQYAYLHNYKPIAIAEFWWGQSPSSEIRKHGHFYPSCRGKCEPILGHMLQGLQVDENPVIKILTTKKDLQVVYEDNAIIIVNKPANMLSVPGKNDVESVYSYIQNTYKNLDGPIIIHRLDMSTSGIMVLAKSKAVHEILQKQFLERTVNKRYIALLDGNVEGESGTIELPIRVDLDNRPQQMVCYEYGKMAITTWKVIRRENGQTLIHFFPHTGRTHQLRVHAAHSKGLNCPIVGDDLYGTKADRLYLHAENIAFVHPVTNKKVQFSVEADF